MATRNRDGCYYVARPAQAPGAGGQRHAPSCFHACGDIGASFGLKPGVICHVDGGPVLNWKLLVKEEDLAFGSGGGGGPSGKPADHSRRLRSLAWVLIMAAGMNASHPALKNRRFFSSLYEAAEEIALSGSPTNATREESASKIAKPPSLAGCMLVTDWFDKAQTGQNRAKLVLEKSKKHKWVLILCSLPGREAIAEDRANGKRADLFSQMGARVQLPFETLDTAFSKCSSATAGRELWAAADIQPRNPNGCRQSEAGNQPPTRQTFPGGAVW